MKKFYSLAILLLSGLYLFGQTTHKVLVEHFTQASCPPCAQVNPIIHPIMERHADKIVRITHQVSWPGIDPMNKDNPGEVSTRVQYYGINSVPNSAVDGIKGASTDLISDQSLEEGSTKPASYEVKINYKLDPNYNEIDVFVNVSLKGTKLNRPVLRVAMLEKVISWTTPPGTNGEKEFHHVMKKYLPNPSGTALTDLENAGDTKEYSFHYKFDKLYNFKNLEIAAFVQDDASKDVDNAEHKEVDFPVNTGVDASIKGANVSANATSNVVCGSMINPTVTIINTGTETINELVFEVSANGGPKSEIKWNGTINTLAEKTIDLNAVEVPEYYPQQNAILINIKKVNGKEDDFAGANQISLAFQLPVQTTQKSRFEFKAFSDPKLIRFEIKNSAGTIILKDGPFADKNNKVYELNLDTKECFTVHAYNQHTSVNATYKLFNESGVQVLTGSVIQPGESINMFTTYSTVTGSENIDAGKTEFILVPNPSTGNVEIISEMSGKLNYYIYNSQGKLLMNGLLPNAGIQSVKNIQIAEPGVYLVVIKNEKSVFSKKLIIQ